MKGVIEMINGATKIDVVNLKRQDNGKIKAFADVMLDEAYVVKGFRVVEGEKGLFVGFPQQPGKDGRWYNRFQAMNETAKNRLSEIVLATYLE